MQKLLDYAGNLLNILWLVYLIFLHEVGLTYPNFGINKLLKHFNNEIVVENLAVFILLHHVSFSNSSQGFLEVFKLL